MAGIRRAPRPVDEHFYRLDKRISEDQRLSWEARGLLIFLLGKPDNWNVSVKHLINQTQQSMRKPSGRDSVRAILGELEQAGYLQIETARDGGKFDGVDYVVHEVPFYAHLQAMNQPETDNPAPATPQPDYPAPADPHLIKTERAIRTERATKGTADAAPGYAQAASSSSSSSCETGQSAAAVSAATSNRPMSQASLSGIDAEVGKAAKKTGKAKATKGSAVDLGMLVIPDWLSREKLEAFIADRADRKKPMTQRAVQLLINELVKIHKQGHDPVAAIDAAIMKGWLTVYAPNDGMTSSGAAKFPGTKKFDPREHINQNRNQRYEHDDGYIDGHAIRVD